VTVNRVKLRYRSLPIECRVANGPAAGSHPRLTLELAEPVDGAAPGQTACLMCDDAVVGWGTIREPDETPAAGAHLEAADAA